jgi:hypothetical protein
MCIETEYRCHCANCDWQGSWAETRDVRDFWQRIAPGEVVPAGECPHCGALAHPLPQPEPPSFRSAIVHLKAARAMLRALRAPKAMVYVSGAIKSAEGAERHARGLADRIQAHPCPSD